MDFTATGCSNLITLDTIADYGQPQSMMTVKCIACSANLNDAITGTINSETVFTGHIKNITRHRSSAGMYYEVAAYDKLILASDYYIAADDPDNPYEINNIAAETLVSELLAMATITDYDYDVSGIALATVQQYPIDRVHVYEMVSRVARWCGYHIWCDKTGTVNFKYLPEEPSGAASHSFTTGDSGELTELSRTVSEENLRNRIVVYGSWGITGIASAASPYLPAGFNKTAVFGHEIIDSQAAADAAAARNLALWNKLTERVQCSIVGDETVSFGETVTVTESGTGTSGDWFARSVAHSIGLDGFITRMALAK